MIPVPGVPLTGKDYNTIKFTVKLVFPVNQFDLFVHMQSKGLIPSDCKRSDVTILKENIRIKEIFYSSLADNEYFSRDGELITNFNWKICDLGLNLDHVLSLEPTITGNNGIGYAAHFITLNILAHVRLPQITTTHSCDDKPDTKDKEEYEKMKEFKLTRPGGSLVFNVGLDINSNLVISPAPFLSEEKYKRYDAKTNRIINVEEFVFKYNDFCKILNVQVKDIAVGDIICGEKAVIAVKNINKNGIITGISFDDNTEITIIPESFMGTDICIVEKLVNLMNPGKIDNMMIMLNTGEENNKMDKKTMIMMMAMQNQNGSEANSNMLPLLLMDDMKDDKALMLMMMMQQNNDMKMDTNTILPFMLLDDNGDKKDMLKTMMIMNMMNQQNNKKE